MLSITPKSKTLNILDKIIFSCLILYSLTFLLDIKINFLTTAFAFGIIKLIFIRPQVRINSKIFYLILLFILCTFLSIVFNDVSSFSLNNISTFKSRFISPLLGIFIIFIYSFNKYNINKLFIGFAFSFFINALAVIYQFFNGDIISYGTRLTGFNNSYMLLCAVNLLILPIIFVLAVHKSNMSNKIRLFYLLTILVNIPSVVFENTRIVYVGLGIIFPLIILFSIKNKLKAICFILLLGIYSFTCFQLSPAATQRFSNISTTTQSDFSNYQRILMWQSSLNMFIEHPLFGVGVGNWHEQYTTNYQPPIKTGDFYHPHNVPLDMFSESGVVGGGSYIILFIYLYYISIKNYLRKKDIISLAYIASLFAYSINCLTDCMFCGYNIKMPTTMFWLFTGFYLILNKYVIISYNNKDLNK